MKAILFAALSVLAISQTTAFEIDVAKALRGKFGEQKEHKLAAYGGDFQAYLPGSLIGAGAHFNFDLGVGYQLPLYSEAQYMVFHP